MNAPDYEAWRQALIAFYREEGGWNPQTIENLRLGRPMTDLDKRTIRALSAAQQAMKVAA